MKMFSIKRIWILSLIYVYLANLPLLQILTSYSPTNDAASFEPPVVKTATSLGLTIQSIDTNASFYDFKVHESPPFAIFYNVFVPSDQGEKGVANSLRIVQEQLRQVGSSYAASLQKQPTIFYNTLGKRDGIEAIDMQIICHDNNLTCTHMEHYDEGFEQVTLQKVHDFCSIHKDHRVVYLHTKGAYHTRPVNEGWRRHMTAAATSTDCLAPPNNTCNLCGWVYYPFWASFMPGNIWTAQCSYIQQLLPPKEYEQKQRHLVKEILIMRVLESFSMRMFPRKDGSNLKMDLYGLNRYADEHWVGSHPAVVPCDVAGSVDLAVLWSNQQQQQQQQQQTRSNFSMAPREAVDAKWLTSRPHNTQSILKKEKNRIQEYYFLGGRLFLWIGLYNQVPSESSWVWKWFPDGARWKDTIAGSNQTMERLIQVLETASFQDGKNVGPFGEELKEKAVVDEKIPKRFASTKALLLSSPGVGSERVRALLEQATGKVGFTSSFVQDNIGIDSNIFGGTHIRRPKNATTDDEVVVVVDIQLGGKRIPGKNKQRQQDHFVKMIPKYIVLVRDPFNVIWSRYERAQTGSNNRHIAPRDFHPLHFAMQAIEWAKEYADEPFVEFGNESNDRNESQVRHLRYEDLMEGQGQHKSLNKVLEFIGDETAISSNDTEKIALPTSPVLIGDKNHVSKSAAFASPVVVDMIWNLVEEKAEGYGYAKLPTTTNSRSPVDISTLDMEKGLPEGRYLTYTPSGGELSDQLLELEIAVELAKYSDRTLFLPPLIGPEGSRTDDEDNVPWSEIIDMDELAERVDVLDGGRGVIPKRFSELTLSIFDRYNTKWDLNDLDEEEYCLSDFITSSMVVESNSTVVSRSPECLFEYTQEVSVLRFVDLIGTIGTEFLSLQVRYAKIIRDAAHKLSKTMSGSPTNSGMYTCLQLKSSGIMDDSASSIAGEIEAYLRHRNIGNSSTMYIMADDERTVKEINDICRNQSCRISSDYRHMSDRMGLSDGVKSHQMSAVESLICGHASEVFTTFKSSLDWYVEHLHHQLHPNALQTCHDVTEKLGNSFLPISMKDQPCLSKNKKDYTIQPCALLFFGLPRAYKEMVLPSIVQNILIPNARHQCDIYVHYYHQYAERAGRLNQGGAINPNDILLLEKAAINVAKDHGGRLPHVEFVNDTQQSFWTKRRTSLEKYHDTTDEEGRPVYFPYKAGQWSDASLDNLVKQWHSIDSVFTLMETTSQQLNNVSYSRVGMFRSDAMFLTPIDIASLDRDEMDLQNQHAVLAPFGKHPINDRMIYGPLEGVRVWATKRFELIEKRGQLRQDPGYEMHAERFLNATILPAIQELGISLYTNPDICFLRARADKSVLLDDCNLGGRTRGWGPGKTDVKSVVESIVGTSCRSYKSQEFRFLGCDFGTDDENFMTGNATIGIQN